MARKARGALEAVATQDGHGQMGTRSVAAIHDDGIVGGSRDVSDPPPREGPEGNVKSARYVSAVELAPGPDIENDGRAAGVDRLEKMPGFHLISRLA